MAITKATFNVVSSALASGNATDGYVLTADGSGNSAWEEVSAGPTHKTFGTSSIMIGDNATGTIDAANYNTGVGVDVFASLTTGDYNTAVGYQAGDAISSGINNVATGYGAMGASNGNYNTAIGDRALLATNGGDENTVVGSRAHYGTANSATRNTVVGVSAMEGATTGSYNSAFGMRALYLNAAGTENVAAGYLCMDANTTGSYNVAYGVNALGGNQSGHNNVAIGTSALLAATSAGDNVAIGHSALAATNNTRNLGIGYRALTAQSGSSDNIAIGYDALVRQTTGANGNLAIGNYAGRAVVSSASTSQLVAIGHNVASHASGALAGYQNVFVGYGIADTADLAGAFQNTALGGNAMGNLTTGDHNVGIGHDACHDLTTGIGNVVIGSGAEIYAVDSNYNIIIGYNCKGVNSGDDDYVITMGVSTGSDRIYNLPDSNATWTRVSDVRLKEEIQDNNDCGLAFINDLRPVTFKWKPNSEIPKDFPDYDPEATERKRDNKMYGLIAQEVKEVLDKHNITDFGGWDEMDEGVQTIAQSMFVYPLIKAVQELSTEVEELKKQLENK